ncbi:hypothetical protein [Rubinisphaera margarita]|uniref:hypothetical protein n=1 Tax=Rubinisphaera margarita TaxID=2909586 RepID=UPI001EE96956|nr:hypothetical protein [Rubinisphaera margarita]MCG6155237.1 hypothetical protein [Rubinisphaera margarita]
MFRRIFDLFRPYESKPRRFVPSSPGVPDLWPANGTTPRLNTLDEASTTALISLCEDYWNSCLCTNEDEPIIRDSQVHRHALEIISKRGNEGLAWARESLSHAEYEAREDSVWLISQLAENDRLGDDKEAIASELVTLAVTPPQDDTKEAEAAAVALRALSVIGGSAILAAVRQILTSSDWDDDDNQWECAEILAELTNETFMETEDPVAAAKAWLSANPGNQA